MNKFLVFAFVVAVYASLTEAATNEEIQNAIKNASQQVRKERLFQIKSAIRDSMISPTTTPQQRSCIKSQIPRSIFEVNQVLNAEQAAAESEYLNLPQEESAQLDLTTVSQQLHDRFAESTANYNAESLKSQCL